ncbi:MAG: ATP-dependent Clp protease ATP-binding subunit ClpX, partial [Clostridia bacterium]|nr:ATP-dependent Clp protease ATP-binding subunit ClpX [Clostridia bacterium]
MNKYEKHCSFCGKDKELTKLLIDGPDGVSICDECIAVCTSMLDEADLGGAPAENVPLKKPAEI